MPGMWRQTRGCRCEYSLCNRPATCSASPGNGVPSAGMPVQVVRQGCARAASRHSAGPVRSQRPPSGEAADGGGPRAPLWGGRSGTEGSCRSQSADRGESESGERSARTRCVVLLVRWVMPTAGCGHRCAPVRSSTPTTRAGEWEASVRF